ncbi:helix-turn-helix domain-containing protein [Actinacidiphila bryophytorum]|uniref:helix-turn-helix domain-containing protein n=1 Tax=Actinacidiphila bryophytorum TaxID=1436133 RepID=UPI002176A754|nr:helix-turn-helix domain-containing protein [Actinacidiphila bryophytorum]UWE07362.1 helix-turn-helix domain-containing protein [Actinacidiphila bryophytorum]
MLSETVFRSEDLPQAERFGAWQDLLSRTHAPMRLTSTHQADFRAQQRLISLGEVTLWPAVFPQLVFLRTPKLIRQSDPEHGHLSLVVNGNAVATWGRTQAHYSAYDFHTNDTSRPYEIVTAEGPISMIGIEVPRAQLSLPWHKVQQAVGQCMSGREGVGALLAQFVTQVTADSSAYGPADAARLGGVLSDLVSTLFASVTDADSALPPETRTRTLVLHVKAFIRRNLHEQELTPASVAAAHYISNSHLHRLFRTEGTTVASYIRDQRLQGARRDLADPALAATPVHVIAYRWGFKDHATFTRAFRAAYGSTPSDCRHGADVSTGGAG